MFEYESEGHQLEEAINGRLEKKPRLRKKYKRPDPSTDMLYRCFVSSNMNLLGLRQLNSLC